MHSVFEMKGSNGQVVKGNKWIVSEEVKQVVVLSHGMNEYTYRYNDFALYLNDNGINVMGLDHIGHGLNVDNTEDLLKWPKNGFDICVDNLALLINKLKEEGNEVILFAHSMGSFMGQSLIERYPGIVEKVILCGTSGPSPLFGFGSALCKFHAFITGNGMKKSYFLNKVSFASYNSKVKEKRTEFDWLSVNKENVDKYIADPYCGNVPSRNFFASFIGSIPKIFKKKNLNKIDIYSKVLFIVGSEDPVGGYVKSIKKLQRLYTNRKISSSLIIYPGMRHEILNEDDKEIVYKDVLKFIKS
ncbi:MAG: alpha/beta hydrolase [Erysipelotrichaceae bacterium]|nr:alpha/beta hydrolase [Erysipelotrichaceae bacterium]